MPAAPAGVMREEKLLELEAVEAVEGLARSGAALLAMAGLVEASEARLRTIETAVLTTMVPAAT